MFKFILDSLDGLEEAHKAFYEKKDDGKYHLKVEGIEDTGALKRAKDHEKEKRKAAEDKNKELETRLAELETKEQEREQEHQRKSGDVDALEKSWQEKLTKRETELNQQIESLNGNLRTMLVDNEATKLAAELAGDSASVLLPHIKSRLGVAEKEGKQVTAVLDTAGQPSAFTLDELKKEFSDNPAFAPVIVGSKASGGGAGGGSQGGQPPASGGQTSQVTQNYLHTVTGA
ncbi:hypothetical protein [Photobacterium sp. 1_MG-2023]|uniref:hypothetical protein n=1 Tax=Photobacterium sp. 1_MG-2023 TaxID=3062646 RepID=UPI0026E446E4|nr:hypothetical protein [Photobacterium sp. 1_MG-2023]MDO6706783.1 hypothetical protein [Photobacterium sp. 1_MG-2023]